MLTLEAVAAAVEHVESRGEWWSKRGCHRGVMQVCSKWSRYPASMLWIPAYSREEGKRLLRYWHGRARGDWTKALAAYRCGWRGLTGACGVGYARLVLGGVR